MRRGEIWWASLGEPRASERGYPRPVLVVQADSFNRSRISTVLVVAIKSNLRLAEAPGNMLLTRRQSKLPRESVVNVSQILTLDKQFLTERVSRLAPNLISEVEQGLRLVLSL
ncbi:MAG: type II toxin-antitoxin system PemK/MazF family toxin [Nitrospirae bacterium]|nr:MAG: type II toxin-antitoxin system PemK/MazF family toxin [Nitrospirota bacterium]